MVEQSDCYVNTMTMKEKVAGWFSIKRKFVMNTPVRRLPKSPFVLSKCFFRLENSLYEHCNLKN